MSEQNPFGPPPPPGPGYGSGGYGHPAPGYGQPGGYGQPAGHQQPPGYQQPGGYGQPPAYGAVPPQPQQAAGWPAPAGFGPPAPPRRKTRKGLYITLAALVGAIGVAFLVLVVAVGDKVAKEGTQKVVLPQSFQGLTSDPSNELAQQLKSGLTSDPATQQLDGTVSTVYNALGSDRAVVVYGGYGKISSPNTEESSFWSHFESTAAGGGTTFGPRTHPSAGPKGGTVSCEEATKNRETDAVCIWVDNSSLVVMMQTTVKGTAPSLDKAAADLLQLRSVAEVPK
jgi:hypothetical protein